MASTGGNNSLLSGLRRLEGLVGRTPVKCFKPGFMNGAELCFKLEYTNPTGSHKDRIAVSMIGRAVLEEGLKPGDCIVEASSGNTGVSVAWAAGLLGLRAVIFVEKDASSIKKSIMRLMGAEVLEIEGDASIREMAREYSERNGCIFLDQSANEANRAAHYEATGPEIVGQLGTSIDAFVMGVGTGGTVTGIGAYLKEAVPGIEVAAVVPKGSPVAGGGGGERIEGLASHHEPELFARHRSIVDRLVEIPLEEALRYVLLTARELGLLVGPSTGAAVAAAARLYGGQRKRVLLIAADSLYRYPEILASISG